MSEQFEDLQKVADGLVKVYTAIDEVAGELKTLKSLIVFYEAIGQMVAKYARSTFKRADNSNAGKEGVKATGKLGPKGKKLAEEYLKDLREILYYEGDGEEK